MVVQMAGDSADGNFPPCHFSAETQAGLHVKCLLFLSAVNLNWNVLNNFSEVSVSNVVEVLPALCRQAEGTTLIGVPQGC